MRQAGGSSPLRCLANTLLTEVDSENFAVKLFREKNSALALSAGHIENAQTRPKIKQNPVRSSPPGWKESPSSIRAKSVS